jgi:hypothetical protein
MWCVSHFVFGNVVDSPVANFVIHHLSVLFCLVFVSNNPFFVVPLAFLLCALLDSALLWGQWGTSVLLSVLWSSVS